tara:strand:+ start:167 stop:484 length:318 start_codon:yes stop_codon:yes gene_type:complete
MSNKIPIDSQEFKDKYTSKTDTEYGVIFVPNVPGLPVLDSNGDEIVGYKKSVPEEKENSFESLLSFIGIWVGLYLFDVNGPYGNSAINYIWKYLHSLFVWIGNLF